MSEFGFVILHYGDVEVTRKCVESIKNMEKDKVCVVVDNDSHKNSVERKILEEIMAPFEFVHILKVTTDAGFSNANNQGYQYLRKLGHFDYVIVCNNDIVFPQEDFLVRLEDVQYRLDADIFAPDIIGRASGEHQNPLDVKGRTFKQLEFTIIMNWICLKLLWIVFPLIKNSFIRKKYINEVPISPQEGIVPCGACLIVGGQFLKKEKNLFSPETKFYYEEYILYERCLKKGYKIVYDSSLKVIHGDGVATNNRTKTSRDRARFIMQNTCQSAKIYKKFLKKRDKNE